MAKKKEIDWTEYTERQLLEFSTDSAIKSEVTIYRIFKWVQFFGILAVISMVASVIILFGSQ